MQLSTAKNLTLCILLCILYIFIFQQHFDRFQAGGNTIKHVVGAEVFKVVLFGGTPEDVEVYARNSFGDGLYKAEDGEYSTAISDLKPYYLLLLSLERLIPLHLVTTNFVVNIIFLLASLYFIASYHKIYCKLFYIFIASVLLAPFVVFYAYVFEAHMLQIVLTCAAMYFLGRGKYFWVGFLMTSSCFAHRSNFVLLFCLAVYVVCANYNNYTRIFKFFVGGVAAYVCVEIFLYVLFFRDTYSLLPHHSYVRQFFEMMGTVSGVAKSPSTMNFVRNSFVFLFLPTVALFWLKDRRQFIITLFPFILYFMLMRFEMPGVHRVLLPVYFLAYSYYINNLYIEKRIAVKSFFVVLAFGSFIFSGVYYAYCVGCVDINDHKPVSIINHQSSEPTLNEYYLHWNLRRFNTISQGSDIQYSVGEAPLSDRPTIPDPHTIYPHILMTLFYHVKQFVALPDIGLKDPQTIETSSIKKIINE